MPFTSESATEASVRCHQREELLALAGATEEPTVTPGGLRGLLPEFRREREKRRFLVTCLSLKTGLRASIGDPTGSWEIDNVSRFALFCIAYEG